MSRKDCIALVIAVVFLVVLFCSASLIVGRSARIGREIMVSSVQDGLEKVFDLCVGSKNGPTIIESTNIVRELISPENAVTTNLPAFVRVTDVLVASEDVSIPSDELLCAVRMPTGKIYGITGKRVFSAIKKETVENWSYKELDEKGVFHVHRR